jgi:eukaryotic-like serine/threonine-protein kinase
VPPKPRQDVIVIGKSIGPYQVLAKLGEGGMGEVYRARDTRLDRDVALKVLPNAFVNDPERLIRFEREAKVLAALNHPNIAAIYGVEDAATVSGQPVRALVMELVEGPTLREAIAGGLSLSDALPIARQIAEALETAHRAGVIHRDLKPANIKIRPDGAVKVLDFGLAKALAPDAASMGDAANSPTLTAFGTQLGTIVGTAAYMAPEQARGKAVDKRADLWALGCVLFEMLTGRQAFRGDTVTDILAAVVRGEPDWSSLPSDTPRSIRTLLRRCLTKDPAQRLGDASTARLEIDDALREPADATAIVPAAPAWRGRERFAWIVAAAMTLVALGTIVVSIRRPAPIANLTPEVRFPIDEALSDGVLSPDGTAIVYLAPIGTSPQWAIRTLSSGASRALPGMESERYTMAWSPDGRSIAFQTAQKLKRLDIATGAVQTLADSPTPRGVSWGSDGTILFAPSGNGPLYRIASTGGTPEAVSELHEPQASHRHPIFLPDGRHFLLWVLGPSGVRGEYLGSLDDRHITRLFDADGPATFAGPDRVLFIREGVLYGQRLDLTAVRLVGEAVAVASPFQASPTDPARVSASATGVIAYRTDPPVRSQIRWVNRAGTPMGTVGQPVADLTGGTLSPDGSTIALTRTQNGDLFIWLMDTSRGTLSRFSNGTRPVWSPDGTRLAFNSGRDGFARLYWQGIGVNEPAELLFKSTEAQNMADWSSDGASILFSSQSAANARDLWRLTAQGADRKAMLVVGTAAEERNGVISPDGKWMAYESDEAGRPAIFVRPFPGPGRSWRVSTADGVLPFWRADSREIYYQSAGQLMAVEFSASGSTPALGTPNALFSLRFGKTGALLLRARTDGQRFLIATLTEDAPPQSPLTIIVNWAGAGR